MKNPPLRDLTSPIFSRRKRMNYKEHRRKLFEDEQVNEEYQKLLPEYKLAKSIIEQIKPKPTGK